MSDITFTDKITVELIQQMGGDHMVVAAARVSVDGEAARRFADPTSTADNAGLIGYLMRHRHGTPFEHAGLTFFVHAPVFVFREWHRHRVGWSYNEVSGRYTQLVPTFWLPRLDRPLVPIDGYMPARPQFKAAKPEQFERTCLRLRSAYAAAYQDYEALLADGVAKEVARALLPVGIYSSCWCTCNPRSLMAFLSLRTHDENARFVSYPQAEIEQAADAAEAALAAGWPITHAAFVRHGRVAP